jgi:hypothetical protein
MFEYTTRLDGSTTWACINVDSFYIEVNITGMTDENTIQDKLSTALQSAKDTISGEG